MGFPVPGCWVVGMLARMISVPAAWAVLITRDG
jgi:hypothetical protein